MWKMQMRSRMINHNYKITQVMSKNLMLHKYNKEKVNSKKYKIVKLCIKKY